MKKNTGFTLVELLAVIVLLAIVTGIAMLSMSGVIGTGKKGIYKNLESNLKGAAENYYISNIDNIPSIGSGTKLYANTDLKAYLNDLSGPDGTECNSPTNNSFVYVTRDNDISNNFNLTYKVCLVCINKSTGEKLYATQVNNVDCDTFY